MFDQRFGLRKRLRINSLSWMGIVMLVFLAPVRAEEPSTAATTVKTPDVKESQAPDATAPVITSPDYIVSPQDLLEIDVFEVPEISHLYRVTANGFLTLPLIPQPVPAAGLTLQRLSQVIAKKFREAGMLMNAQVTIAVRETRLSTVVVSGAVMKPQVYPVFGPTPLLDVLAMAGGLDPKAGNSAIITRGDIGLKIEEQKIKTQGGEDEQNLQTSIEVAVRKLMETGDKKLNVLLYPGDRVTVPEADLIYVLGAVKRPGGYTLTSADEEITVLKALALAGDTTDVAKRKDAVLLRKDPAAPEGRKEIALNLKDITKGQAEDLRLRLDDILYVPESGRKQAMRQIFGTALGTLSGLIVYNRF